MSDRYNLQRFIDIQKGEYDCVIEELRRGRKHSHWMWFIFPQIEGLGRSPTAKKYSIKSAEEARAYLNHSVLGERLKMCTSIVLDIEGRTAEEIFGYPDCLKFHSCMTLFSSLAERGDIFEAALSNYFGGQQDGNTFSIIDKLNKHT